MTTTTIQIARDIQAEGGVIYNQAWWLAQPGRARGAALRAGLVQRIFANGRIEYRLTEKGWSAK